jgi:hypothetical protein
VLQIVLCQDRITGGPCLPRQRDVFPGNARRSSLIFYVRTFGLEAAHRRILMIIAVTTATFSVLSSLPHRLSFDFWSCIRASVGSTLALKPETYTNPGPLALFVYCGLSAEQPFVDSSGFPFREAVPHDRAPVLVARPNAFGQCLAEKLRPILDLANELRGRTASPAARSVYAVLLVDAIDPGGNLQGQPRNAVARLKRSLQALVVFRTGPHFQRVIAHFGFLSSHFAISG